MRSLVNPSGRVVLGDVLDIRDGTHDTPAYVESGIPLITSKNLSDAGLTFESASFISEQDHAQISKRSGVQKGDVLYGMIGTIGKPTLVEVDRAFSIKNIALFKQAVGVVDPKYLRWLLDSPDVNGQIARVSKGGTQKFVALGSLRGLTVHLPPLEEQRRIAAILDQADTLRTQRRVALVQLDSLTQSLFLDMFGDPLGNPKLWDVVKLESITKRITKGESPGWQGFDYQDDGALFVTSENVRLGAIDLTSPKFIPLKFNEKLHRSELKIGDILVNLVGASIGRSCIYPGSKWPANINQAVAVVTPDAFKTESIFLAGVLVSESGQSMLLQNRVEGARANISLTDLRELVIPLPPLLLQQTFATRIQAIEALKATHRTALTELDALFASLQQRAFAGEL